MVVVKWDWAVVWVGFDRVVGGVDGGEMGEYSR